MFTNCSLKTVEMEYESLALAPVSVLPEYQNKGIGSKLILLRSKISKEMGFESVIVLGHDKYYPRFGFSPQVNGEFQLHLMYPNESFWLWNLKMVV